MYWDLDDDLDEFDDGSLLGELDDAVPELDADAGDGSGPDEVGVDDLEAEDLLDGLDPECLDDLDVEVIRDALECGAFTTDDLEERGFDAGTLFALGLGAFLAGGLMGGEPRRKRRRF